jgi:hypothetical protein
VKESILDVFKKRNIFPILKMRTPPPGRSFRFSLAALLLFKNP